MFVLNVAISTRHFVRYRDTNLIVPPIGLHCPFASSYRDIQYIQANAAREIQLKTAFTACLRYIHPSV